MHCRKCQAENPSDKRFCGDCGAPLSYSCSKCGSENPPANKFCGDCGASLPAASVTKSTDTNIVDIIADQAGGERKIVTALFADLKGSTALMEHLDPEDAHALVEPALHIMVEAVRRYDGYVVRTAGDGIFALFGAPLAYEDHPQRALYAALRMQEELRRYSGTLVSKGANPLEARVGVHTGEVVAYSVETSGKPEYRLIGHTANLASRLESIAPVGSIAIAESTRKLCEGYFALKTIGPTPVKGLAEPVNVYTVVGLGPLRTRLQRATARGLTKFVGRQREMETLRQAGEQAKGGHGQLVAVMADAGTGKSRLYFEFKAVSQSDWMVLEAFSVSHGKATAYLPVLELLHDYMRIVVDDDSRTRREKVTGRVLALDRKLEDALPHLFALIGISEGDDGLAQMDGNVRRRRTHDAIKRILLRESLNQPLMLIFEDLHWIDAETQMLLNMLVDAIGNARILLLVNYRPEYRHEWGNRTYYTQVRLDPLGHVGAEQMLDHLLGADQALAGLKRLIIDRTEGNPFFMEETVQALLEDGALVRDGTVKLTKSLDEIKMPLTVQAMLSARIDRLPPAEKELLQTMSVIGKRLEPALISQVTGKSEQQLDLILANLQIAEFIYEQPSIGGLEYVFKHALTQEVAYGSMLAGRRRLIHEQTASAIEKLFADQLANRYSDLAHHHRAGANAAKAVNYAQLAATQALSRAGYSEAAGIIEGALQLLDQLPDDRARLSHEFALRDLESRTAFALQGGVSPRREQAVSRMYEIGERLGGKERLLSLVTLSNQHFQRGQPREGIRLAQSCISMADSAGDPGVLADAHLAAGLLEMLAGNLRQALTHYESSLHYDRTAKSYPSSTVLRSVIGVRQEAWEATLVAGPLQLLGRVGEAARLVEKSLPMMRESRHAHGLSFALTIIADTFRCYRREAALALAEAEEAIVISEENGFAYSLCRGWFGRGWALAELGRLEEGVADMERGIAGFDKIGGFAFHSFAIARLGYVYAKTGRNQDGLAMLNRALADSEHTGAQIALAEILRLKGEVLLMQDHGADAEHCFSHAIEVARRQEARWWELRASVSLARFLRDTGRCKEGLTVLAHIYNWFTDGFETRDLQEAKALLDEFNQNP